MGVKKKVMAYQFKEKTWEDYSRGNINTLSTAELRDAVRKAAKAANQRLVRLERRGYTKGVYERAINNLVSTGRRRFKENTAKLTRSELSREYKALRDFISAKTSTVQGRRDTEEKRYQTAVEHGYTGTMDDFELEVERAFSKSNEALYSSNVIYQALTTGKLNVIESIVQESRAAPKTEGEALLAYARARQNNK